MDHIFIQGARTHNLKNIDLTLPREKLIVITGPSGSGKSSLAFDTLYAEGQRRYVESLSAYARQFLSMMDKPDVDQIAGLSPAISIQQKTTSHNPRSTVGTTTEIYDYLRLLFARAGTPYCPTHHQALEAQTVSQMVDTILNFEPEQKWMLLAPIVQGRKGSHVGLLDELKRQGFLRARINGEATELEQPIHLSPRSQHDIEVIVDRFKIRPDIKTRLAESLETALRLGQGWVKLVPFEGTKQGTEDILFSARYACPHCGFAVTELEPRLFSFNNPAGACPDCNGLGDEPYFEPARLLKHPELSIDGGAIPIWPLVSGIQDIRALRHFAKVHQISLKTPFQKLEPNEQKYLLYGAPPNPKKAAERFPGFMPFFSERYRKTESERVRDALIKCLSTRPCLGCRGSRLKEESRHVLIGDRALPDLAALSIRDLLPFFETLKLTGKKQKIADKILEEIQARLSFLNEVGLNYLSLDRRTDTLSGGEAQRIRLASQIGSALVGVLYILDEPTIGLHQRDNARLLDSLMKLKNLGNTVIVVEHDEDTMRLADHVVDMGPGAGIHGGTVMASGTPQEIMANPHSVTGAYLSGRKKIPIPKRQKPQPKYWLELKGARGHNLKTVTASFPLGLFVCVTGVSGSGKSTLINDTLYPILARHCNRSSEQEAAPHDHLSGLQWVDKVICIDQAPIGRTPRSNPATYTGILTPIREIFAAVPESRTRGYTAGRFSFNVKGGRCEACEGDGLLKIAMHFLPDVYILCEVCNGHRYNRETLSVTYKGKSISEVLAMTVEEAADFFEAIPIIFRKLETLKSVGLGYIQLGQSATTLSGGEAQRIKLAKELSKRDTGNTVYLLDEPTTGLHFQDVTHLIQVLLTLRDRGNTIIVIEHHLDLIKSADWIVDLGPSGGDQGGQIIATGTPEEISRNSKSETGRFLKHYLK